MKLAVAELPFLAFTNNCGRFGFREITSSCGNSTSLFDIKLQFSKHTNSFKMSLIIKIKDKKQNKKPGGV
jgi:hypothetical protein